MSGTVLKSVRMRDWRDSLATSLGEDDKLREFVNTIAATLAAANTASVGTRILRQRNKTIISNGKMT